MKCLCRIQVDGDTVVFECAEGVMKVLENHSEPKKNRRVYPAMTGVMKVLEKYSEPKKCYYAIIYLNIMEVICLCL